MRASKRGFTLMEVMVAVAILGLSLTAILAAQAGALSSAAHARNISVATGLVRCKMTEIEERLTREAMFPEMDEADSGACCEGDESSYQCSWRIEKPEFPEPKYGDLDLDTSLDPSGSGSSSPLAALAGGSAAGANPFEQGASPGDIAQTLAAPDGAAGALSGMLGTVLGMVYPDLKGIFEASTRRISVKITWMEGSRENNIEIGQWFTIPQRGQAVDLDALMGGAPPSSTGTSPSPPRTN